MFQSLCEQPRDVVIVQGVKHLPAVPARSHETEASEESELMRDGRLAESQKRGDVADAELRGGQRVQNPDPGGIAEDLEGLGQGRDVRLWDKPGAQLRDHLVMGLENVAGLGVAWESGCGPQDGLRHLLISEYIFR